jgi:hypothetical protein
MKGKLIPPASLGRQWLGNPFWPQEEWGSIGCVLGRDNNRGRVGWQKPSPKWGFHVNNEWLPSQSRR